MKKNLLLVTLLLFPIFIYGELFLEITKGSEDPYKVAMIPFEGNTGIAKQLNNIMRNDLIRTGEFSILDEELLLPVKIINDELVYNDWKLLGIDYLVTGTIVRANNSLDINYEIFDIHKKRKVRKCLVSQTKSDNLLITLVMESMSQSQESKVLPLLGFCMSMRQKTLN